MYQDSLENYASFPQDTNKEAIFVIFLAIKSLSLILQRITNYHLPIQSPRISKATQSNKSK